MAVYPSLAGGVALEDHLAYVESGIITLATTTEVNSLAGVSATGTTANAWNSVTGVYTAPTDGFYRVWVYYTAGRETPATPPTVRWQTRVVDATDDSTLQSQPYEDNEWGEHQTSLLFIVDLDEGDTIKILHNPVFAGSGSKWITMNACIHFAGTAYSP